MSGVACERGGGVRWHGIQGEPRGFPPTGRRGVSAWQPEQAADARRCSMMVVADAKSRAASAITSCEAMIMALTIYSGCAIGIMLKKPAEKH